MKVYLAAGWFSVEQEASRMSALSEIKRAGFDVYSPKEDLLYEEGMDPQKVFEENIDQINGCDFVVASTAGKDMGTLFECGYAFAVNIPIIYYWYNGQGKFNLMLSQSGRDVATTPGMLRSILETIKREGYVHTINYKGEIE